MTEVSLVLPAYNEADRIRETVSRTAEVLSEVTHSFEIIIAEDGSTDGTAEIASSLAERLSYVRHMHSDERLGRGQALTRAFKASRGEVLAYIDVDLATDMSHLPELIDAIRVEGYDMATGSRMLPESQVSRSVKRRTASIGYNFLTRLFLHSKLRDHQCGFKSFRRESLMSLVDEVEDQHWFWDTEVFVRAQARGMRVKEFPVRWVHGGPTKVDMKRDIIGMGSQILRLAWQLRRKGRGILASALLAIVILAIIATFVGFRDVLSTISTANPLYVAGAIGLYVTSWPVRGWRYRSILRRVGHRETLGFLTGAIFISQTANIVLPARIGDAARAYLLKRERDIPLTSGFSTLALERVFDVLAIILVGAIALLHSSQSVWLPPWIANTLALGGGLAVLAMLGAVVFSRPISRAAGRVLPRLFGDAGERGASVVQRFFDEIRVVSTHPRSTIVVLSASLLIWAVDVFTCFLVLDAFGYEPLLSLVFLGVAVGNLAKIFPVTPGAIGTYEAALTAVFGLAGIPYSTAFAAAVIDHLVKNVVTLVFGGAYLSHLHLGWADIMNSGALESD